MFSSKCTQSEYWSCFATTSSIEFKTRNILDLCSGDRPEKSPIPPCGDLKVEALTDITIRVSNSSLHAGASSISLDIPLNLRCRIQGMLVRSCLIRRLQPTCSPQRVGINACTTPSQSRAFHQTPYMGARPGMPNHYETLGIETSATPQEVKKYDMTQSSN